MKLASATALFAVGLFSALVSAAPGPAPSVSIEQTPPTPDLLEAGTNVEVYGPLPYKELKAIVEGKKIRKRGNIGGVYLCDEYNFQNAATCYYAIYPLGLNIHPDPFWAARISSVGPDEGTECIFSNDYGCNGNTQWSTFPGGNLYSGIDNNLWCFKCWAGPIGTIGTVLTWVPVATEIPKKQ